MNIKKQLKKIPGGMMLAPVSGAVLHTFWQTGKYFGSFY